MASITKYRNTYRVQIRSNKLNLSRCFSTIEDAQLYACWKQDIVDQMNSFEPKIEEVITLKMAIELKLNSMMIEKRSKKSISDYNVLNNYCEKFLDIPLNEITYENIAEIALESSKKIIYQGGSKLEKKTINAKFPSKRTIINKINLLQGVFSYMIEKGLNIENHANKVIKYLRTL